MKTDLRDDFGRAPLHCASNQRHQLATELLLDMGADQSARDNAGNMLIHGVARAGDERLMRRLLRDKRIDVSATARKDMTALHSAAIRGHANIVHMLLDVGAKIDARDGGGWTALYLAAGWGREDVVQLLVKAGANVNCKTDHMANAMFLAAAANYEGIRQLLLEHGAEKGVFHYLDGNGKSEGEDESFGLYRNLSDRRKG